eukprot:g364.t1
MSSNDGDEEELHSRLISNEGDSDSSGAGGDGAPEGGGGGLRFRGTPPPAARPSVMDKDSEHAHPRHGDGWKNESLDYDAFESRVNTAFAIDRRQERSVHGAAKWVFALIIGCATAMTAIFIDFGVRRLEDVRHSTMRNAYEQERAGTAFTGKAALLYMLIAVAYALVASVLVGVIEPIAGGSGIPEIKTMLNGVDVPRAVRMKTLLCKAVGVLFSVAAGLPCGKEGPMIHSGAIWGAAVSQGKSTVFGFDLSFSRYVGFRNERERRDFVSCGAAAGVAAAFGAPVGGMLFALEEGASFWHPGLTWRSFFCAVASAFTLSLFMCSPGMTADEKAGPYSCSWGHVGSKQGTFGFGAFDMSKADYLFWYIIVFVVMGAVGGLFGALFNALNTRLTHWRKRHRDGDGPPLTTRSTQCKRVAEALVVAAVMAGVTFGASIAMGQCLVRPTVPEHHADQLLVNANIIAETPIDFDKNLVRLNCQEHEYNDLGSLFLVPASTAIKSLFHYKAFTQELIDKSAIIFWNTTEAQKEHNLDEFGLEDMPRYAFSTASLVVFFVIYYAMACWTYGLSVPSGLFVPSLLAGAAYGQLWWVFCDWAGVNGLQPDIHPGLFTLVGAAALLGGMARMTISLAVILMELTGVINWGPPVMLALLAARLTGNAFNEGLYDIHVHLAGYDFLEYKPHPKIRAHRLRVHHVMAHAPVCVTEVVRAGDLLDMLQGCTHNAFPVVPAPGGAGGGGGGGGGGDSSSGVSRAGGDRTFMGVVLRKALCVALQQLDLQPAAALRFDVAVDDVGGEGAGAGAGAEVKEFAPPLPYTRLPRRRVHKKLALYVEASKGTVPDPVHDPDRECLAYRDLEESFPRFPRARDIALTPQQRRLWLDVTPYVNQTPPTVSRDAPLKRAYALFRNLGLRHLVAVDWHNNVAGMVTRHDLAEPHLHAASLSQSQEAARRTRHAYHSKAKGKGSHGGGGGGGGGGLLNEERKHGFPTPLSSVKPRQGDVV